MGKTKEKPTMDLKQISPSDAATAQDGSKWPEFYSLLKLFGLES